MNDRAGIYERLTALPYIHAYRQLIMGAVELDVFTQLETSVTAGELSGRMSWNEYNTLNLCIIAQSRIYYAMAQEGHFFSNFK